MSLKVAESEKLSRKQLECLTVSQFVAESWRKKILEYFIVTINMKKWTLKICLTIRRDQRSAIFYVYICGSPSRTRLPSSSPHMHLS